MSASSHYVCSGVALIVRRHGVASDPKVVTFFEKTEVTFASLSKSTIDGKRPAAALPNTTVTFETDSTARLGMTICGVGGTQPMWPLVSPWIRLVGTASKALVAALCRSFEDATTLSSASRCTASAAQCEH